MTGRATDATSTSRSGTYDAILFLLAVVLFALYAYLMGQSETERAGHMQNVALLCSDNDSEYFVDWGLIIICLTCAHLTCENVISTVHCSSPSNDGIEFRKGYHEKSAFSLKKRGGVVKNASHIVHVT